MSKSEKSYSAIAFVFAVLGVVWLASGQNVLGVSMFALGAAMYAYATTPHDGDERIR